MEYIRSSIVNDIDEAVSGQNETNDTRDDDDDDDDDGDEDFFKSKKRSKTSPLQSYLASDIVDATVYNGRSAPLKRLALRLNTPLPASAAVERPFSYGGLIMRPHRNRLNDDHFEFCLLLKLNREYNIT